MQIRNNYEKEIFNGDIGFVRTVKADSGLLEVSFDGRTFSYESSELNELILAYAITIHKSQGSEFTCVVLPLHTTHYPMLQRNLLYTGVTRGKKLMILVGSKKAIHLAISNRPGSRPLYRPQRVAHAAVSPKKNAEIIIPAGQQPVLVRRQQENDLLSETTSRIPSGA